jgi:hypothetical protein
MIVRPDGHGSYTLEGWVLPGSAAEGFEALLGQCCGCGEFRSGGCAACQEALDAYVMKHGMRAPLEAGDPLDY